MKIKTDLIYKDLYVFVDLPKTKHIDVANDEITDDISYPDIFMTNVRAFFFTNFVK